MSIPFPAKGDKTERFDLLVAANPVWETSWLVQGLPVERFDPRTAVRRIEDGGGSSLNTACALARAGRRVIAAGRVGDDREGHASIAALERRGVATRIEIVPGRSTKRNVLYADERTGATAFQAIMPEAVVEPWEEDPPALREAAWLLLDRLPERVVDWLRPRRATGLHNALSRYGPWRGGPMGRRLERTLPFLDFLQLPERDLPPPVPDGERGYRADRSAIHRPTASAPLTDNEVAAFLGAGVRTLVRTRGARGVVVATPDAGALILPAVPTDVVDPTGAGDALTAGILDGLLSDAPLREAVERGLNWAARACRRLGARGWLDE